MELSEVTGRVGTVRFLSLLLDVWQLSVAVFISKTMVSTSGAQRSRSAVLASGVLTFVSPLRVVETCDAVDSS